MWRPLWLLLGGGLVLSCPAATEPIQSVTAPAEWAGRPGCASRYPTEGRLGAAFLHVFTGDCWSCPKGSGRTANPDVGGGGACVKAGGTLHVRATRHGKGTGLLGTDCPQGSGQFWHIGDGYCYRCPRGYHRTTDAIDSIRACAQNVPPSWSAATRRGPAGCPEGAFQNLLLDQCYRCPKGYARSLVPGTDLTRLPGACVLQNVSNRSFVEQKRDEIEALTRQYADLIAKAVAVAERLVAYQAEIRAAAEQGVPLSPELRRRIGLNGVLAAAAEGGFPSITVGVTGDVSLVVGGSYSIGVAQSTSEWLIGKGYHTWAITGGASVGADASPEIAFWKAPHAELAGTSHGAIGGATYGSGAALGFWWSYDGPFQGFSVNPQVGLSAELEYVRSETALF